MNRLTGVILLLLLTTLPPQAGSGFDEQYGRDDNPFYSGNRYDSTNPVNSTTRNSLDSIFNSTNRYYLNNQRTVRIGMI